MSLAFSPDSSLLASGSWDSQILVWRLADQKLINTLAPGRPILSIAFSPDGRRLASGTWENGKTASVILWDTKAWSRRETLSDHPNEVSSIAYAPDGSMFASVGPAGTVFVRDAATNRPLFQWKLSETVYGVAFSADSRHLVLGHNSGAAFVYRLQTLAEAPR